MTSLNRNASPSASTRHTSAPTRSGGPSGGTNSSCTVAPVFNRALVLTFAPCVLMSTDLARYRLVPTLTTTGQATRVRGRCRRFCCGGRGMRGHSRQLACQPGGRWRLLGRKRIGRSLLGLAAFCDIQLPRGRAPPLRKACCRPPQLPGTTFRSAFVPPAVLPFASLSVGFWGPPELG